MKVTKPYRYQASGVRRIERFEGRVLLADEMGLGKSLQALLWIHEHLEAGPTVIVCPAFIKPHWVEEALHHIGRPAQILSTTRPPRRSAAPRPNDIYVINYDILQPWVKWLRSRNPRLIVADECQNIANPKTKRAKALRKILVGVPHFIALSGTPLVNRPSELWNVLNLIDPGEWPAFFSYAQRYCRPEKKPWGWEYKGAVRLPELHAKLKDSCMIRRTKAQVLSQLPAMRHEVIPFELSPKDRKEYDRAERDLVGWLQSHGRSSRGAEAAEALVKRSYTRRLAGQLKLPDVIEWVQEFLAETEGKIILFGIHQDTLGRLHEAFGRSVLINGTVTPRKRRLGVESFRKDPKCRVLLGNYKAAGAGWNGTVATTVGAVEYPWAPGDLSQAFARIHRIGQSRGCRGLFFTVKDSIESDLIKTIRRKERNLDMILDGVVSGLGFNLFDRLDELMTKRVVG